MAQAQAESTTTMRIQNPLSDAILNADVSAFNVLVQHGSGLVNQYDHNKETPLHLAARLASEYEAKGDESKANVAQEMAHQLVVVGGASMDIPNGQGMKVSKVAGDDDQVAGNANNSSSFQFSSTSLHTPEQSEHELNGGNVQPRLTESSFNQNSDSLSPELVRELLNIPNEEQQHGGARSANAQNLTTTTISTPYSNEFSSLSFESLSPSLNLDGGFSVASSVRSVKSKASKSSKGGGKSISQTEWNSFVTFVSKEKDLAPSKALTVANKLKAKAMKQVGATKMTKSVVKVARSLV